MPNIKTAKAKGRRLQNYVRDRLRHVFIKEWTKWPKLEQDDIKSQTMGMTGEDIILSPAARKIIPYSFECKNQERISIWKALQQAEDNAGLREPIVVIKRNGSNVYATLRFVELLRLIRRIHE
mgnify:CR=1 FL=1